MASLQAWGALLRCSCDNSKPMRAALVKVSVCARFFMTPVQWQTAFARAVSVAVLRSPGSGWSATAPRTKLTAQAAQLFASPSTLPSFDVIVAAGLPGIHAAVAGMLSNVGSSPATPLAGTASPTHQFLSPFAKGAPSSSAAAAVGFPASPPGKSSAAVPLSQFIDFATSRLWNDPSRGRVVTSAAGIGGFGGVDGSVFVNGSEVGSISLGADAGGGGAGLAGADDDLFATESQLVAMNESSSTAGAAASFVMTDLGAASSNPSLSATTAAFASGKRLFTQLRLRYGIPEAIIRQPVNPFAASFFSTNGEKLWTHVKVEAEKEPQPATPLNASSGWPRK